MAYAQTLLGDATNKNARLCRAHIWFAVREGFEPSVQLPVRQFSKLILSASQAPHQLLFNKTPFSGTANIAIRLLHQKIFSVISY
jgi:hypothetical protein